MKTGLKKLICGLFAFTSVLCFAFAGIGAVGAEEASSAKIYMNSGAAIRKADGDYGTGLRFFAELSKEDYDALVAADTEDKLEFGIILTVKDFYDTDNAVAIGSGEWKEYIVGAENNPSDMYYLRGACAPKLDKDDVDNDGDTTEMLFMLSITNIKDGNLARKFVARAYYTTDGENYVYSDAVAQRNIFDVATRAYADEEYREEVAPVIDKVCEAYPDVSFSVADIETQKKPGDKLAVSATLSNAQNSVAAYVTATADKEGMLALNADGTYTINRLGDFTLTAALGFDSVNLGETKSQEFAIDNANTRALVMKDEVYADKEAERLTEVTTDYYNSPIYKLDLSTVTDTFRNALKLKKSVLNEIHAGEYILFDIYKAAAVKCIFDVTALDENGKTVSDSYGMYSGGDSKTLILDSKVYFMGDNGGILNECDKYFNTGYYIGKWHTVAIKINSELNSAGFGFTAAGAGNITYIKDFRIAASVEQAENSISAFIFDSDLVALGSSTKEPVEFGGRKSVIKYTATQKGSDGALALDCVGARSKLNTWVSGKGKTFASFDIYAENAVDLYFFVQGKAAGDTANKVYSANLGDTSKYATQNLFDVKMSVGNKEIDLTKEDINDYLNQWVTVRITYKSDIVSAVVTSTKWGGAFGFNTVGAEGSTVYISNAFMGQPV